MKKIVILLFAFSIFLSFPLTAYAHDVPQERDDCSIEVIVRYDGENIDGGTLAAIKVGCVAEEDGNYFFAQEFTGVKIEDITSSNAPQTQREFYKNNKNNYDFYTQIQLVEDGKAVFTGLSTGLYLIVQEKAAEGFSKLQTFLVSVPYMDEDEYRYHVTAAIKSEAERQPEPTDPPPTKPDPDSVLPQTGRLNGPVLLLVVAGLVVFTVGWMFCFGKREKIA